MTSKVYFSNLRTRGEKGNKVNKVGSLFEQAQFGPLIRKGDLTAIKLHFGERGNDGFINPVLVRPVVDRVKAIGANPFLTDTNTLYSGSRHNAVDHLITALEHGFDYTVAGAPLIISDGLRSDNIMEVRIGKKHFSSVKLARDIVTADSMIVMTHFKAHEMSGFGGAIKNMAMGGAPAMGKKEQHACRMVVNHDSCIGCGSCREVCPQGAVSVSEEKASIEANDCIGCGECLTVCPEKAIELDWTAEIPPFMERMTEYAYGVARSHEGRIGYMNFLTNITPDCDCCPWSDAPIVPDIGFLASTDPVAIDQASFDLVNAQVGISGSLLEMNLEAGKDKFNGLRSITEPTIQLSYGEEIGLGSRDYELVTL
ncbi:MAG: DUF362 domain-containing protein [Methanomassiliicoccus sp.]|nr:DUF362 domain-containing protein [Methanomassiliicoccus sp.]